MAVVTTLPFARPLTLERGQASGARSLAVAQPFPVDVVPARLLD